MTPMDASWKPRSLYAITALSPPDARIAESPAMQRFGHLIKVFRRETGKKKAQIQWACGQGFLMSATERAVWGSGAHLELMRK